MKTLAIEDYIKTFFGAANGSKTTFAKSLGTTPQQVNKWITKNYHVIVDDDNKKHTLVSSQKELPFIVKAFNEFEVRLNKKAEYPLFCKYENNQEPENAYITVNVNTGGIDADYSGTRNSVSCAVYNNEILRFACDCYCTKTQINEFINNHLSTFQALLSIFKVHWMGSDYQGKFIAGFECSNELSDLANYIDTYLKNDDSEYIVTELGGDGLNIRDLINPPLKNLADLDERIKNFCEEYTLINGLHDSDVYYAIYVILAEKLFDEEISKEEAVILKMAVENGEYDIGRYKDELNNAVNQ